MISSTSWIHFCCTYFSTVDFQLPSYCHASSALPFLIYWHHCKTWFYSGLSRYYHKWRITLKWNKIEVIYFTRKHSILSNEFELNDTLQSAVTKYLLLADHVRQQIDFRKAHKLFLACKRTKAFVRYIRYSIGSDYISLAKSGVLFQMQVSINFNSKYSVPKPLQHTVNKIYINGSQEIGEFGWRLRSWALDNDLWMFDW